MGAYTQARGSQGASIPCLGGPGSTYGSLYSIQWVPEAPMGARPHPKWSKRVPGAPVGAYPHPK